MEDASCPWLTASSLNKICKLFGVLALQLRLSSLQLRLSTTHLDPAKLCHATIHALAKLANNRILHAPQAQAITEEHT